MKNTIKEWLSQFLPADVLPDVMAFSGRLGIALIILVGGFILARIISRAAMKAFNRSGIEKALGFFLRRIIMIVLMVLVVVGALDHLGVPTTSMFALLGAGGLAIGLALKDSMSNVAAGVLIIFTRPFRAGDAVEIAGLQGTVDTIHLLQTHLITPDNRLLLVPNAQVMAEPIINVSARGIRRLELTIGIAYESDPNQAFAVIEQVIAANDKVLSEPPPKILVTALADSSVNLVARPWAKVPDYFQVQSELLRDIKSALDKAGIGIPYPQRVIHTYTHPAKRSE